MTDYPYIKVIANLKKFFPIIQSSGVPEKVTLKTLESYGFKSTNDRRIINVLKSIQFLSDIGIPTDHWKNYRNKEVAPIVLGKVIKITYQDLFTTYPDAHRRDNEAIRNFFSTHTKVGEQALSAMVSTFKTLCDMSKFEDITYEKDPIDQPSQSKEINEPMKIITTKLTDNNISIPLCNPEIPLSLNINIELHLPASNSSEVYDNLFQSLRKHLLNAK
jgi:hypothetical protein